MIDYIRKTADNQVLIVSSDKQVVMDKALHFVIEQLANERLSSLEGRITAVKKLFGFKAKCPIYLGRDLLLMQVLGIRSEKALLINIYSIKSIQKLKNQKTRLTFARNHFLDVGGFSSICELLRKARIVEQYRQKSDR
ncbi:MAG: competence protein ComK [Candidatus Izemoplasmatales bacterium]|jgi:competence transcription factor ComK|nr:competence protein ComK [Candidatus Izemoplasmatales bacterium]